MRKETRQGVRLLVESVLLLILLVMFFSAGLDRRQSSELLASHVSTQAPRSSAPGAQGGLLQAAVVDLEGRWFGSPALWQPPPITNTDIQYFDVTGRTQGEIVASFKAADICKKDGPCAVDPAVPSGGYALGLEWESFVGSYYYCYSPATTTLVYREHVLLPRWSPSPLGGVRTSVILAWNALLKSIYTHEAGHVTVSIEDIASFNTEADHLPSCQALEKFWNDPHTWDKLQADQNAYHARLRADCRAEIGCIPYDGWMGWYW
jgi:uncharacterized protein DUF922